MNLVRSNNEFIHYDQIAALIDRLNNSKEIHHLELLLRKLENNLSRDNYHLIVQTARTKGAQFIENPSASFPSSQEEACFQRYIEVPILYKLGFTKEASELSQLTFEYLFPKLHFLIENKLKQLFQCNEFIRIQQDLTKKFSIKNVDVLRVYGRIKSTHSIWKKISNIQEFQAVNLHKFANMIDDFIALRWNMRVNEKENRYDALLNGIPLIPKDSIFRFRNQQIAQQSGFFSEPVMKFYYIIQSVPIELQLLGGHIEQYMCVKGYSQYKTGLTFFSDCLTKEEQNARFGLSIHYAEAGDILSFSQMMLQELISEKKLNYDTQYPFLIESLPKNPDNLLLCFADCDTPVYLLDNYEFTSRILNLTK